ncbi:hypothetical protein [Clostridium estertheticum]|uniref:hypothetical protein n=1 Tax=Clostridium estertheticum TaxID=238834 RepID=UPI001C0E2DF9|nr:hypothetical protein [Clostridium estertheticum]MBU3186650.1 hypothetical protein [Clostridium estertheticum]
MISLITIKDKLISKVKFQETPVIFVDADYISFIIEGAQRLYVDAGLDSWDLDYTELTSELNRTFDLTEREYILIASEIAFRNQIKDDISAIIGYTTNAISITGANSPYKNAEATILLLESRLSKLAFKFTHKQV